MNIDQQKLSTFPAFFKVAHQKVVIIGNGAEAYAKLRLMRETMASLVLVADAPQNDLATYINEIGSEDGHFVWLQQPFSPDLLYQAVLVFAAYGNEASDKTIAEHARAMKIAVNVVDRPDMCDFFTPALINRAPISVAIGSQGASPVLTQMIRAQIEALLHPQIGKVAGLAAKLRALVDHSVKKGLTRRHFWFRFFNSKIADRFADDNLKEAEREAFDLIDSFKSKSGKLYLLNVENLSADDITLHSQRVLLMADGIVYDEGIAKDLLTIGRRDAERYQIRQQQYATASTVDQLFELIHGGQQIVRLYNDSIHMQEEIRLLHRQDLDFTTLPSLADRSFQTLHHPVYLPYALKAA